MHERGSEVKNTNRKLVTTFRVFVKALRFYSWTSAGGSQQDVEHSNRLISTLHARCSSFNAGICDGFFMFDWLLYDSLTARRDGNEWVLKVYQYCWKWWGNVTISMSHEREREQGVTLFPSNSSVVIEELNSIENEIPTHKMWRKLSSDVYEKKNVYCQHFQVNQELEKWSTCLQLWEMV